MKPTSQTQIALANLAIAVALGAFGAHALKPRIPAEALEWFKTGHSYHMWLGLAILAVSFMPAKQRHCTALLVGTLFFSGSLYLLAVTGIRWLGAITPIGGVVWIVTLALLAIKPNSAEKSE